MALRVAQVAVILGGIFAVVMIVKTSLDPRTYFHYAHLPVPPWEHPTTAVALVSVAAILETAILYAAISAPRPGRLWARGLIGLWFMTPWAMFTSMFVVHMPGYWLMHIVWVWAVLASLALIVVVSGALDAFAALRSRVMDRA